MQASLFVFNECITEQGETAEECLRLLEHRLLVHLEDPQLTFRPADGVIFCHSVSSVTPIGVLYRVGYLD